jgi:hypothetical protein
MRGIIVSGWNLAGASRMLLAACVLVGLLRPALADTVDAEAKPYLVAGGCVAALAFAALGVFLLQKGLSLRRLANAAAGWPTTDGRVLECTVAKRLDKDGEGGEMTRYIPQVRYAYNAGGAPRQGSTIRLGLTEAGYMVERQARDHIARYAIGGAVPVRYNPENPGMAVLELGQVGGNGMLFAGAIFAALALAAVVFAAWIVGLEAR